jgi:hypothetical protein
MKYVIWAFCLVVFSQCTTTQTEQPTLSDEKMAQIMADLSVAEAATLGLAGYSKDSLLQVYFAQVFTLHETSVELYEKDLRLVSADMRRLQRIVERSVELLDGKNPKANE